MMMHWSTVEGRLGAGCTHPGRKGGCQRGLRYDHFGGGKIFIFCIRIPDYPTHMDSRFSWLSSFSGKDDLVTISLFCRLRSPPSFVHCSRCISCRCFIVGIWGLVGITMVSSGMISSSFSHGVACMASKNAPRVDRTTRSILIERRWGIWGWRLLRY